MNRYITPNRCMWLTYMLFTPFSIYSTADLSYSLKQIEKHKDIPVAYLFAHGLGATGNQGVALFSRIRATQHDGASVCNQYWLCDGPLATFNFPDAKNDDNEYHAQAVTLGQQKDLDHLHSAIQKTQAAYPHKGLVLTGISRGSAAIINYIALYQPTHIKAAVLESPFDAIKTVIRHLLKRFSLHWFPFSDKIAYKIAESQFPALNLDGIFPIKVVAHLPYELPLILIHSKKDKVVPIKSSRKLYVRLKESGHSHVYLLELPSGAHGKLLQGPDAHLYHNVIHAFYKKYSLPHDQQAAVDGQQMLTLCQPSINEIKLRNKRTQKEEAIDEQI